MTKHAHSSQKPQQENLIEPPIVIDLLALLTETKLSENEQGILKRRLLENRKPFEQFLQRLLQRASKKTVDIGESLKKLEKDETREIRSFDAIAKVLSKDFPELLRFILEEYEVEASKTRALIGKEFVFIKRIADVIFEAKDKTGNEVIIHLEFERKYQSDEEMDKRKLEYRHLMEMDDDFEGKNVLCNVFYLKGSPEDKAVIEERMVKLPTGDPRYSGELRYKAYHLSLVTIEMILQKNLPFLLPFVVESELKAIKDKASKTIRHISSIRQQIDQHEEALTKMIKTLTTDQIESLRTTVAYLWEKSYSEKVFNQSNLLDLMRERLNLRQDDIQLGKTDGMDKGMDKGRSQARTVVKRMLEDGKVTTDQLDEFMRLMDEVNKPVDQVDK